MAFARVASIFKSRLAAFALGAAVCGGAVAAWFWMPHLTTHYTTHVGFGVVTTDGVASETAAAPMTPDAISQLIARQQFIFEQDGFLENLLKSEEFHPGGKPTPWLAENSADPVGALKRDLHIVPHPESASFELTMTTRDAGESCELAKVAAQFYMARIAAESRTRNAALRGDMEKKLREQETIFQNMTDVLMDYSKHQGLDVQKSRYEYEKAILVSLSQDFIRAEAAATMAEQQYNALKQLEKNDRELPLTAELMQKIEQDSILLSLITTRNTLEQDLAAARAGGSPAEGPKDIEARLQKIDEQMASRHAELAKEGRQQMETAAAGTAARLRFQADYLGAIRRNKEDIITAVSTNFLIFDQKLSAPHEQQELVNKLRNRINGGLTERDEADRIVKIAEPVPPTTPD